MRPTRKGKGRNPLDKCKLNKHMVLERTSKKCSVKVKPSSKGQSISMVNGDAIKQSNSTADGIFTDMLLSSQNKDIFSPLNSDSLDDKKIVKRQSLGKVRFDKTSQKKFDEEMLILEQIISDRALSKA